jgi:hypothetical protein
MFRIKPYYFLLIFLPTFLFAQPKADRFERFKNKLQTVQALKEVYFNKELNLTESEKESFWPVYNKYFEELKIARFESKNDVLNFEEKIVSIRKNYKDEFKKILGNEERAKKVFILDRNFVGFIKKELFERQKKRAEDASKKAPTIEN